LLGYRYYLFVKLPELLSTKFIFFLLKALRLHQYDKSTAIPGLNRNDAYRISVALPPLAEQKRIVEKIEELFSDLQQGIESLKTAQKQLKVYRQVVLKWAFEGKLTEKWRASQIQQEKLDIQTGEELLAQIKVERDRRYQQQLAEWKEAVREWEAIGKQGKKPTKPQKLKDLPPLTESALSRLPKLPDEWRWIQLGEILDDIEAGKSFKCDERPPKNDEVGVAKVSAVTWGKYNELESKTCLELANIDESLLISSGDFLFSRANTIQLVGACVIAKKITLKVMLSDKTLRFRFSNQINKKFILYFLRSQYGRKEIERLATGNQESMRNIGQDRIQRIRTPFPSSTEQEEIVQEIESRLSICDRLEATIIENLQKAEALRQSILKQAFEAKLVPQDPNDEPAEKLLERIKQEKTKVKNEEQLSIQGL
jgi:type I restriction enzyme S subunit